MIDETRRRCKRQASSPSWQFPPPLGLGPHPDSEGSNGRRPFLIFVLGLFQSFDATAVDSDEVVVGSLGADKLSRSR